MALSRHEYKAVAADDAAPSGEVLALVRERGMYLNSVRSDRVISVDEQLALRGWCVDAKGELHRVDPNRNKVEAPKPASAPAPEEAPVNESADEKPEEETPAPKRRGRPRKETAAAEPAPENTAE